MHRRKTRFARTINRVARSLERRGVAATYELHDHVLANAAARRRHARAAPALDEMQRRIVEELRADGYALLSFTDLFPDPGVWSALDASARAFIASTEEGLARETATGEVAPELSRRPGKEFVIRRYPYGVELGLEDPWLRLAADRRMLDIANAYHGFWSKLEYVDLWYTPPVPEETPRRVSQNWHRDYNDRHLLKAFIYLVDVDEGTGPFEFIPGTEPGAAHGDLWPWRPAGQAYPPLDEFEAQTAGLPVRTFTGPKGTMLFCNTAGLHRGGFATGRARVLATFTYDSAAALKALSVRNYRFAGGNGSRLDPVVRYALA
jgi:hypothetical protein